MVLCCVYGEKGQAVTEGFVPEMRVLLRVHAGTYVFVYFF